MRDHGQAIRQVAPALIAALVLCLSACGGSDGGGDQAGSDSTAAETLPAADVPPAPEAIAQARSAVQRYCTQVAAFAAGRRPSPTPAEFARVSRALERLALRAELTPKVRIPDGSTSRLALGDLAENLEGTNCDQRLVDLIDARLVTLPPD